MAYLHHKYYGSYDNYPPGLKVLCSGVDILNDHPLLSRLEGGVYVKNSHLNHKGSAACVTRNGQVYVNQSAKLTPEEWAYAIAHCLLHLAFGHFDEEKIPQDMEYFPAVWNKACDIYVARFLSDIGFGSPLFIDPAKDYSFRQNDEIRIYEKLLETEGSQPKQTFGLNSPEAYDMIGIEHPLTYKNNEKNEYRAAFSYAITHQASSAVGTAGGHSVTDDADTPVKKAAAWFLARYPLLGGLAASFKIIEDMAFCQRNEIQIAAVDASLGEIYANPVCGYTEQEWRFVLAHEYLHAGLCHHKRCQGRDPYLWNVACDYVINDWLHEMRIGEMPRDGLLYDETLHGLSAENIYDIIVKEMRRFKKHATFRGYGKGDIFRRGEPHFSGLGNSMTLDDFFKNSLREGLDYHMAKGRGFLPAGLVEEIRALTMPPIPWEVELAEWFDIQFPPLEKHRTYARPSRRQGSTPDIPRPSYTLLEQDLNSRTFGVVIDTSGSMSEKEIGLALGAIASYAVARDVPFVRLIFCDAQATDAGYMAPEDIAGRVEVTGRGGTVLQPGVDALEKARDFPKNGPILIITDGLIENDLKVKHEHAYLIPKGARLPFTPKGKIFYFQE